MMSQEDNKGAGEALLEAWGRISSTEIERSSRVIKKNKSGTSKKGVFTSIFATISDAINSKGHWILNTLIFCSCLLIVSFVCFLIYYLYRTANLAEPEKEMRSVISQVASWTISALLVIQRVLKKDK